MKEKIKKFVLKLFIFSLLLVLIAYLLKLVLPEESITPVLPYLFLLFFVVTMGVHYVVLHISELKPARFVTYFMLATFVKLIVYMATVLIYVFTVREHLLPFIIAFFLLYIFYTIFEVVNILTQTKDMKGIN